MAIKAIQLGQVWRKDDTGENYLVTKLYRELFTQFVMLRRTQDAANADTIRLKVLRTDDGLTLPGYTFTQDTTDF